MQDLQTARSGRLLVFGDLRLVIAEALAIGGSMSQDEPDYDPSAQARASAGPVYVAASRGPARSFCDTDT